MTKIYFVKMIQVEKYVSCILVNYQSIKVLFLLAKTEQLITNLYYEVFLIILTKYFPKWWGKCVRCFGVSCAFPSNAINI